MVNEKLQLDPGDHYKGTYKLIGGSLCFDFTNTVSWRGQENSHEWFDPIDNLVVWAQLTHILDTTEVTALREHMNVSPEINERTLHTLITTRETLYRAFSNVISDKRPDEKDLQSINIQVKAALSHLEISSFNGGFELTWQRKVSALQKVRYSVIKSAADVLITEDLTRVKKCPSCQWLYLDKSKNKSRRWCTMEDCGNRHKVNAFHKNKKRKYLK